MKHGEGKAQLIDLCKVWKNIESDWLWQHVKVDIFFCNYFSLFAYNFSGLFSDPNSWNTTFQWFNICLAVCSIWIDAVGCHIRNLNQSGRTFNKWTHFFPGLFPGLYYDWLSVSRRFNDQRDDSFRRAQDMNIRKSHTVKNKCKQLL